VQASGFADGLIPNPLQRRCTWTYDQKDAVAQANIARCVPPAIQQLNAFKDFENKLYDDVYPVLVRTRLDANTVDFGILMLEVMAGSPVTVLSASMMLNWPGRSCHLSGKRSTGHTCARASQDSICC
jgi:hypothetical protein